MRVLVTRPMPDAETTAAELERRGHSAVLAPMLTTLFSDWQDVTPGVVPEAIVATSPNGVRGLVHHPDNATLRNLPLFVAGDASGRLATRLGFTDVRSASGDASDVVRRITADLAGGSRILYVAGQDVSGDLRGDLLALGYDVERIEIYRAVPATHLPSVAIDAIQSGAIDAILVFSARTAEALITAIDAAGLLPVSRRIPIHAISQQAAEPLRARGFLSIVVASRPDAAELIDTLVTSR